MMKVHLAIKLVLKYSNEIMDQFSKRNLIKETLANGWEATRQGFPSCLCHRFSNKRFLKSIARYLREIVYDFLLRVQSSNFN